MKAIAYRRSLPASDAQSLLDVELPAPADGTLTKILKRKGETAKVGEVVAQMEAGKNEAAATTTTPAPTSPAKA